MKDRVSLLLFLLIPFSYGPLTATPVFSTGAGSAVSVVDRSATFDSVADYTPLENYSEGGLRISVQDYAYTSFSPAPGFSGGFHYPSGGALGPTVIAPADSVLMYAIEFNIGSGFVNQVGGTGYFAWETRMGATTTGGGWFTADISVAQVAGFADPDGFDMLLVANYQSLETAMAGIDPGGYQALAIDNLNVQVGSEPIIIIVPEPSSFALVGFCITIIGLSRRR